MGYCDGYCVGTDWNWSMLGIPVVCRSVLMGLGVECLHVLVSRVLMVVVVVVALEAMVDLVRVGVAGVPCALSITTPL